MAAWQYTIHLFPDEYVKNNKMDTSSIDNFSGWRAVKISTLSATLSATFGPEQMLYGARSYGLSDESCAHLLYQQHTDSVSEISFRLDLRSPVKAEVEAIFLVARRLNALIVTQDFKIITPMEINQMKQALLASDAAKFVKDPAAYFENLKEQEN